MNYSEYPELAARTEGSYSYLRCIWAFGRCEEVDPKSSPPSRDLLRQMRFQHAIIGLNTETAEVADLIARPHDGEASTAEYNLEVAKELGDVMWYTVLLFRFLNGNDAVAASETFARVCASARNIAAQTAGNNILPIVWASELDQIANKLLKRLKNQMFYGSIPDESLLIECITGIILRVAQIGLQHEYTLPKILELNIDKLKRKFPNGFNGIDAETKRHEVGASESVSTQVITPGNGLVRESRPLARHMAFVQAEAQGLVYPKPLGPCVATELLDKIKSHDVAAVPLTNEGAAALTAALHPDSPVIAITHDSQPSPALPQVDLAARALDLSEFDVRTLESVVATIRNIHEGRSAEITPCLVENMSGALERLGWQPTRETPVADVSGNLPSQPLS